MGYQIRKLDEIIDLFVVLVQGRREYLSRNKFG